jgi:integrase/recombinase XerD
MSVLSTLFEQFLRERRYLRNVTPKTVMWYQTAFDALTRTVGAPDPRQLGKPVLQDFVVRLWERGLSPVSCNTYVKAINSFLAWLHAEGHVREPLALQLQRTEKRIVQTLTVDQLKRLVAIKPKTVAQLRARLNRSVQPAPLLHPNMADFYLEKGPQLARGLDPEKEPTPPP